MYCKKRPSCFPVDREMAIGKTCPYLRPLTTTAGFCRMTATMLVKMNDEEMDATHRF